MTCLMWEIGPVRLHHPSAKVLPFFTHGFGVLLVAPFCGLQRENILKTDEKYRR